MCTFFAVDCTSTLHGNGWCRNATDVAAGWVSCSKLLLLLQLLRQPTEELKVELEGLKLKEVLHIEYKVAGFKGMSVKVNGCAAIALVADSHTHIEELPRLIGESLRSYHSRRVQNMSEGRKYMSDVHVSSRLISRQTFH